MKPKFSAQDLQSMKHSVKMKNKIPMTAYYNIKVCSDNQVELNTKDLLADREQYETGKVDEMM